MFPEALRHWRKSLEDAWKVRGDYDARLLSCLELYEVQSEAEFVTGCATKMDKSRKKRRPVNSEQVFPRCSIGMKAYSIKRVCSGGCCNLQMQFILNCSFDLFSGWYNIV